MKIIKRILLALLALIAILLIVAFFLPKEYAVEREITINKPKDSVFLFAKYLKNQDLYSTWNQKDPKMKKSYSGTDGTVGFISSWESTNEEVGVGEQEIKKIVEGQRLDVELRFKVPYESTDYAYMTTEALSPTETKVNWGFKGKMPYPMNLMMVTMNMEGMLGKELQTGLDNLKAHLEQK